MNAELSGQVLDILAGYQPETPAPSADRLRQLWLGFGGGKVHSIRAEQQEAQETAGIPVPILKEIGDTLSRSAQKHVQDFLPLAQLLWEGYGREGRVVALPALGTMELADPEGIVPLLHHLCRSCITWEDCDRLAMDALEPIVRKQPEKWLPVMETWLMDENKWVRRAGVTVVGRLAMKQPRLTTRCLDLCQHLLFDTDDDVRKAVSFAIRICVRGEVGPVVAFLQRHVPPQDPAATWVLCDVIRSMGKAFLKEFRPLLPEYERWAQTPGVSTKDKKSIESAVGILRGA
jgi:3-methyladenine DNA glycosylase AlkD